LILGILAGLIYGVTAQRSPAPPIIALIGLLGMLVGEQLPPLVKNVLNGKVHPIAWSEQHLRYPPLTGHAIHNAASSASPSPKREDAQ
jgi:XapX domain-containing protein